MAVKAARINDTEALRSVAINSAGAKFVFPSIPNENIENFKKIKNINSPILVMHGEQDTIVPFTMGKTMYQLANEPKYSYFTKHDDHMMVYDEAMIKTLKNFIKLNFNFSN